MTDTASTSYDGAESCTATSLVVSLLHVIHRHIKHRGIKFDLARFHSCVGDALGSMPCCIEDEKEDAKGDKARVNGDLILQSVTLDTCSFMAFDDIINSGSICPWMVEDVCTVKRDVIRLQLESLFRAKWDVEPFHQNSGNIKVSTTSTPFEYCDALATIWVLAEAIYAHIVSEQSGQLVTKDGCSLQRVPEGLKSHLVNVCNSLDSLLRYSFVINNGHLPSHARRGPSATLFEKLVRWNCSSHPVPKEPAARLAHVVYGAFSWLFEHGEHVDLNVFMPSLLLVQPSLHDANLCRALELAIVSDPLGLSQYRHKLYEAFVKKYYAQDNEYGYAHLRVVNCILTHLFKDEDSKSFEGLDSVLVNLLLAHHLELYTILLQALHLYLEHIPLALVANLQRLVGVICDCFKSQGQGRVVEVATDAILLLNEKLPEDVAFYKEQVLESCQVLTVDDADSRDPILDGVHAQALQDELFGTSTVNWERLKPKLNRVIAWGSSPSD